MTNLTSESASGRVLWIQESGKTLLSLDLSYILPAQSLQVHKEFEQFLMGRDPASVLLLLNLTQAHYNASVAMRWKSTGSNATQLKATAVYGASGILSVAVRGYLEARRLLNRKSYEEFSVFKSREDALAWLLQF